RKRAAAGEPRTHPPRAGIVTRCSQTEIAELCLQLVQITCRIFQCLDRIERIGQAAPIRRLRHELRNTLRALGAHGLRVEAALLPDHASEEFDGKAIRRSVLLDGAADVIGGWGIIWRSGLVLR